MTCCCAEINKLNERIERLEQINASNEHYLHQLEQVDNRSLAQQKDDFLVIKYLEYENKEQKQYIDHLETLSIELSIERWLVTELLESLGLDCNIPMKEAIIELAKKLMEKKNG